MEYKIWLSPSELEIEYGFSKSNQGKMRMKKLIPFSKVGSYIRYNRELINKWLSDHHVMDSTS